MIFNDFICYLRLLDGFFRHKAILSALDRASLFADDGIIRPQHLPPAITARPSGLPVAAGDQRSLPQVVATFKGTRSELAKYLGVSERTLYRRLREQGLDQA